MKLLETFQRFQAIQKVPFIVIQLFCPFYIRLCAGNVANTWIRSFNMVQFRILPVLY